MSQSQAIFVSGVAGFVGYHTAAALLARGEAVVGLDNVNAYYDPSLKWARLQKLQASTGFRFVEGDVADHETIAGLIVDQRVDRVVHLAAQAGVRYSLEAPFAYSKSNLTGHLSILEAVRRAGDRVRHLVYASSSSVYGNRAEGAFSETDPVDSPVSLYAATKRADELLSQSYSHLFGLRQSGLRFFTVYGPWGRPDMAYWLFTDALFKRKPIQVFNQGLMRRDFTYIDDVVQAILMVLDRPSSLGGHRIFNVGNNRPEQLSDMIDILEKATGVEASRVMLPMQPGDVLSTCANVSKIEAEIGWKPSTSLQTGLARFVEWFRGQYGY